MTENLSSTTLKPYVGTRPFEIGEPIFGRDREIVELTNRLIARRVLLLHALSGAGKTSLIKAGIIPVFLEEGFRVLPVIRVNKQSSLDYSFNRYLYSLLFSLGAEFPLDQVTGAGESESFDLEQYLTLFLEKSISTDEKRSARRTLLIFDQFEEILSLDAADQLQKEEFFAQLLPVLYSGQNWVLFAMREDYLAELEPYLAYFPDRLSSRMRLEFLEREAAIQAIREPVRPFGVEFVENAAERLVDDLRQIVVWSVGGVEKKPGRYVEPMHLQVVCSNLWEANRPVPSRISMQDVELWGDVDDALRDYYNMRVADVADQSNVREQDLRDWIEYRLITDQGLRSQVMAGQESEFDLDPDCLNLLTQTHLIRREERRERIWYELAHDRIVQPVIQANAAWRQNLTKLNRDARPWKIKGKPEDLLLKGEALRQAESFAHNHPEMITTLEREFLKSSQDAYRLTQFERSVRAELGLNLEDTGWGVIFAADADPLLPLALRELLDHRRAQATSRRDDHFKIFNEINGYRPGETVQQFLTRFGAGYGPTNPERVPYYIVIVGDPETIPFEFQYNLDVQYSVGRIYFETLEEYQNYARSVVLSESGNFRLPNHAILFGTRHPDDPGTNKSYENLLQPLTTSLQELQTNWRVDSVLAEQATKQNLAQLFGGDQAPALLFTATHGMGFPFEHEYQLRYQGALLTQDWPGSKQWTGQISPDFYFTHDDVPDYARLLGLVAFLWGEYTAGTPAIDDFPLYGSVRAIAPRALLARLPQRLLGHPLGGALGVIGHVERVWAHSFSTEKGVRDLGVFEGVLNRLMQGYTLGKAMELLNQRYTLFNTLLAEELKSNRFYGKEIDDPKLYTMMTQTIDARNYILIGDPAARLAVNPKEPYQEQDPDWQRPAIEEVQAITSGHVTEKVKSKHVPKRLEDETAQWNFNGINALTGEYWFPPLSVNEIADIVRIPDNNIEKGVAALREFYKSRLNNQEHF